MDEQDVKRIMQGNNISNIQSSVKGNGMTLRQRFNRVMHFQTVDRIPNFEFGYWSETLPAWHKQGLPEYVKTEQDANEFFGFEPLTMCTLDHGFYPGFEYRVLEEDQRHQIVIDEDGVKCEVMKDRSSTIPHFLDFPIKNKESWDEYKRRLNPEDPARIPKNWKQVIESHLNRDYPLGIWCGSLLGRLRNLIGFEQIAVAFYDMPDLMHEMIDYMTDFSMRLMEKALKEIDYDYAMGWEDIAFNNGPMISPAMFKEFLYPNYKRIGDVLHKYGVDTIYTDCDGDINPIVDQWIDAGYSCLFPVEVHGGTDPVKLREKFGDRVKFIGGVDKMKLKYGKSDILEEMKRLEPVINQGGFIPHVDHRCPPDVPYENYLYYLEIKKSILGF
jgi:uroporphyrinogen-III decarboxylase